MSKSNLPLILLGLGAVGGIVLLSSKGSRVNGGGGEWDDWGPGPTTNVVRGFSTNLGSLLGSFSKPSKFKALVSVADKTSTGVVHEIRQFSYQGTSDDYSGWNPASTVKLYAAVSALLRAKSLGFTENADILFTGGNKSTQENLRSLVADAVGPSDNIAYNRLVQVSGYDFLNCDFLSPHNGIENTALRRAYAQTEWKSMGESASFVDTPALEFSEGSKYTSIPSEDGTCNTSFCYGSACTTLEDLSECMMRTMLQMSGSFNLGGSTRAWLGSILSSKRTRGEEMVTRLRSEISKVFSSGDITIYHKAGFSLDWYSDVALINIKGHPHSYTVCMAGYPGRDSLNSAAVAVGKAIAQGVFDTPTSWA